MDISCLARDERADLAAFLGTLQPEWGRRVRGPAEALLMAIAGRAGVVRELAGSGQRKLAAGIGVQSREDEI